MINNQFEEDKAVADRNKIHTIREAVKLFESILDDMDYADNPATAEIEELIIALTAGKKTVDEAIASYHIATRRK